MIDTYSTGWHHFQIQYNRGASSSIYMDGNFCLIAMFTNDADSISFSVDLGLSWTTVSFGLVAPERLTLKISTNQSHIYAAVRGLGGGDKILRYDIENEVVEDLGFNFPDTHINYAHMSLLGDTLLVLLQTSEFFLYDGNEWHQKTSLPGEMNFGMALIPSDPPILAISVFHHNALYTSNTFGDSWEYLPLEHEYAQQNAWHAYPQYDPYRDRVWIQTGIGTMWIDADELVASVSTGETPELHPIEMEVIGSYPNPFNASTRITYNVTKPGDIKLRLYDITGRLIKECLKEYKSAGKHEYMLDASSMPSGTYFMRLDMDYQAYVEKITLVK